MRIDPQIRALRDPDVSQRSIQGALEDARDSWLAGPAHALAREMEAFGQGAELASCPGLSGLFADDNEGMEMVEAFVSPMLASLARHPLGHVPLRHQFSDKISIIELIKSGQAALTLITYDALEIEPTSVSFGGGERHEKVLAGVGDFLLVDLLEEHDTHAAIDTTRRRLVTGETLRSADHRTARLVTRVHGRMVLLRLARTEDNPCDTRQFSLADGRLLHRASGSRNESRREMAMALLGRMGRKDAAPLLAELSQEGSDHIRWQSLRECLALDTAAGFSALLQIASDPSDSLSGVAAALRGQLVDAYPTLAKLEVAQCPA